GVCRTPWGGAAPALLGLDVRWFFFSSRRRHTRCYRDWSSDVCSSDLARDHEGAIEFVDHIFCPHSGQNLAPAVTGFPQLGHGVVAAWGGVIVLPQFGQNLAPCWTWLPHFGHETKATCGCGCIMGCCICAPITWGMRTIPAPRPAPPPCEAPRLAPMSLAVSIRSTSEVAARCLIQNRRSLNWSDVSIPSNLKSTRSAPSRFKASLMLTLTSVE